MIPPIKSTIKLIILITVFLIIELFIDKVQFYQIISSGYGAFYIVTCFYFTFKSVKGVKEEQHNEMNL
jgi:hypothetical protein